VKAELTALLTNEVQDREYGPVRSPGQSPAQLLEENRGALGGTQQQDGVHFGQIKTLVEQINGEDTADLAGPQPLQREGAFGVVRLARNRNGGNPCPVDDLSHVDGVLHGTKPDGAHVGSAGDHVPELPDHLAGAGLVARIEGVELADVIAAALPLQAAKVDVV
jgi:hypothetical protein